MITSVLYSDPESVTMTGNIVFPMSLRDRLRFTWRVWCAIGLINDAVRQPAPSPTPTSEAS
jgi:hypothetical protein